VKLPTKLAARLEIALKDEAATLKLGGWLANHLNLLGDLGAGKSTLARSVIRSLTRPDEEVPSPTFTLVQTYVGADFEIAHLDLYRLSTPEEVYEIGLFELARTHLCLIEWPERLGHLGFDAPWIISLQHTKDEGRTATIVPPSIKM
jgi:tRNA threonylcarbamoyladenosine biosynthesis protein TsaE